MEKCPTCGSDVEVVSGDEGTSFYKPMSRSPTSDAEHACVNIYLSLHVSQLGTVSRQIREAWEAGQDLYAKKTGA